MHWFLDPITKHYADFEGRVGRQEFWMFVLFSFLIQIAFDIVGLDMISALVSLALLVPSLALGARRLHDIDKSGWWQLLGFVIVIGWIILIIWFATKTKAEANKYGSPAVPKVVSPKPAAPAAASAASVVASDTAPATTTAPETLAADSGSVDGSR
jgi:uncharacterized membrane protein YhaH (DUF805 family)